MSDKTQRRVNYFVLFLSITIFLFGTMTTAQSSWNSQDWGYRRAITVSNSSGNILTNYQFKVTLNNSFDFNRCKTDGSDIRFTSDDSQTLIPYWIEEWNPTGTSAIIWVKVPTIPLAGTTIYLYYNNPGALFPAPAPPTTVDLPPTGPWTNIANVTVNGRNGGLLAENMVEEGGIYWQLFADRNICNAQLGLAKNITGDPGNASAWNWDGNLIIDFSIRSTNPAFAGDPRLNNTPGNILDPYLDCPHIEKGDDGYWYLFYHWIVGGDPHGSCGANGTWSWTTGSYAEIGMARSLSINGPYTEMDPFILKSSAREGDLDAWDWARVSEPYVFKRDDGKWIMLFMGDKGNFDDQGNPNIYYIEQCSYAIADNISGPYTKWHNGTQPFIAFGPSGSLDAGTIADAHPVKFGNTYYLFYAASPSTFGWSTMYLTTTDWENVTKSTSYVYTNEGNSPFRGAISKFNNTFYFSYLGSSGSSGGPFMIATQPATGSVPGQSIYGTDAVFDFYDGFDGITLDRSKWNGTGTGVDPGYTGTAVVSGGELVVTNVGNFTSELSAKQLFGIGKMFEARAKHSSVGFGGEIGFGRLESGSAWSGPPFGFKNQRIMDLRVINGSNFVVDADNAEHVESPGDYVVTSTPLDFTNYLTHKVMRVDDNNVKFQLNDLPATTISNTIARPNRVTSDPLGPWFFVLGGSSMNVDWLRVRGYADPEPTFAIDPEQPLKLTITASAGSGGFVSPSGNVIVNYGGNQSFTISPNAGYHITEVLVDGSSAGVVTNYTFNNVTANHTISANFAINTYTITATAGANGTVTPSGITTVNHGGSQTYSITPNSGYNIVDVLVDGSSVGALLSYSFTNVTANHTISASFEIIAPTLIHYVSSSGSNTSPYSSWATAANNIQSAVDVADPGDLILVGDGTYTLTTNISVTKSVTIRSVNGYGSTIIDGNLVTRCFYTNNVNAVIDGFTIRNGRILSGFGGGVQCDNGTVQNCIIENNAARDGGGVALNNSGLVLNCIIRNNTADWGGGVRCFNGTVRGCLITGNTATPHGGGINIWSGGTIQNCTITNNTATDGAGIRLWNNGIVENSIIYFNTGSANYIINTGTGNSLTYSCTTPLYTGTGNISDDPQFVNAGSGDYNLTSTSTLIDAGLNRAWMTGANDLSGNNRIYNSTVDIGAYEYTITNFSIDASVVGSGGSISPLGNVVVSPNSDQSFTITPDLGYHVNDVLVDGSSVGAVTSYTFTNVTANHAISASFAINTYTLTITSVNGTVTKNPDQANYNHGSTVELTAAPSAGYTFTGWSGDATGSANPLTVTMDGNKNITANFAINTYTLTITSVNGTVTKDPDQANYSHGSTVELTATPSGGYIFSGWSGDATGSANPLTITMDGNKNITANFAVDNSTYITIGSTSATAGSSITIPVSVHLGGGTSIPKYILQGKIIFDPAKLKYRANSIGSLFTSMGWTFSGYSSIAGQFNFTATGYNTISTDGILFNLNFDVISNTDVSTQITSLPSYWLSNNSSTPALFSAINPGTISITSQSTSTVVGDVNGNFNVDFNDAIAIINHVLSIFTLEGQALINADVDLNGHITLADAIGVILYCTFGDWSYSLSILSPLTNAYLSVDNPVVNNSGVVLPLNIKNADNVRSLEVTVDYDPAIFNYESFSAGINSSNTITKASQVLPGQAKFVFASNELMNNDFSAGSITLKTKNGTLVNGGSIQTRYKINDGNEVAGTSINTGVTDVGNDYENEIPSKFELVQNYPNPFNPTTVIDFRIPINGYYTMKVFNAIGQTVSVLAEREFSAGNYKVTFDGNNLSSGIYFYQLIGNGVNLIRKMMLIK